PTEKAALELVESLRDAVGMFKVGLELLHSEGPKIIHRIMEQGGRVFLDGKFLDIPNTVANVSRAITRHSVDAFNVHALGGLEMLKAALRAATEEAVECDIARPLVLGVTILTSIDELMLRQQLRIEYSIEEQVVHLASLCDKAGLDGVIASPREIRAIRQHVSARLIIVTPGVRPKWAVAHDQKRILTPYEAILNGASYLVVGRPITQPPECVGSPVDAARLVRDEVEEAFQKLEGEKC
ncbi:orotidine-5'-phosphate decarboxylase, partial [Candidatus Pacearchaeota archaeon]|nr:orotidine-5'-phosphate decarboxylase [Candidatus Pacearchaeota archaeon]